MYQRDWKQQQLHLNHPLSFLILLPLFPPISFLLLLFTVTFFHPNFLHLSFSFGDAKKLIPFNSTNRGTRDSRQNYGSLKSVVESTTSWADLMALLSVYTRCLKHSRIRKAILKTKRRPGKEG